MIAEKMVGQAVKRGASDIHMVSGIRLKCRVDGALSNLSEKRVTRQGCERLAEELLGADWQACLLAGERDLAVTLAGRRCRAHLFLQQGQPSIAIRLLAEGIPGIETLGLPEVVHTFADFSKGLVLVTGETGSGKSTTLASLINHINHRRPVHVITLEDPIEYLYQPDLALINQREIGRDTLNFATGLRSALREDPDVLLVGEMRDLETVETAILAAETGHLVFATLHTGSAVEAIDRIVNVFPEGRQPLIRTTLSMTLKAVLSQRLLPRKGGGRVLACEVMMPTPAICHMIREGKLSQIENAMLTGAQAGSITMAQSLEALSARGEIASTLTQG
ncbi:type IV pilus twitching motility protein PilT [Pseudoramibacter alactolyticus]